VRRPVGPDRLAAGGPAAERADHGRRRGGDHVNPVALCRRLLWWLLLTVAGGVRMDGSLPRGGAVLVANHSSHLDTAALLATVDTRRRPRVAAAADYWFTRTWRAAVCRLLAGGLPVRR